jgi:hypothetical protein
MNLSSARNHLHSLAERKAAFADYYSAHKDSECFDWLLCGCQVIEAPELLCF